MDSVGDFESALATTEANADLALKAAAAVARELKRAKAGAATGQVRELRRALEAAVALADQLAETAGELRAGYGVDEGDHLSSGGYAKELLAAAADSGVAMFEEDGRLLCYPSVLRVLPGDSALDIDHRRERRLRPSVVVEALHRAQQQGPRFKPEPFLASLASAYDLEVARVAKHSGAVVRLVDVYGVLTLLPGQGRDYSRQEFARDLYLLDQSGHDTTRDGRQLRWSASTGTRGAGVLTTVARSGQQQRYWGIAFSGANR